MSEVALMAVVATGAFVSSSLDNLFLLLALLGDPHLRVRDAAIGYGAAMAVVMGVAVGASYLAGWSVEGVESADWLRFAGLAPLALGVWRLRDLVGAGRSEDEETSAAAPTGPIAVFALMLAASGDSLAVYSALMAESSRPNRVVIVATTLCLAAGTAAIARWLAGHPVVARRLRAVDRYGVPFLLVAIGVYILLDTPTDTV